MEQQAKPNHCVYKHILPDGRYYIGLSSNYLSRWEHNGLHYKDIKSFYPYIEQYGWNNIEHIVLHSGLTLIEAQELERKYIKEAKDAGISLNRNNGGTPGGRKRRNRNWNLKEDSIWHFVPVAIFKNGQLVGEYDSLHQAARELGIARKNLQRSIQNRKPTKTGYLVIKQ